MEARKLGGGLIHCLGAPPCRHPARRGEPTTKDTTAPRWAMGGKGRNPRANSNDSGSGEPWATAKGGATTLREPAAMHYALTRAGTSAAAPSDKRPINIFLKFSGRYADNQESGRQHARVSALFNMMILYPSGRE
ncbi:hypothetical protein WJ542_04185 [Paraburkholderia sp. B3]|uniref:hypothetical protein n=1 Tax=Paraburkholderia sp. B3 TaxID=3134791 RepID=UPI003982AA73